MVGVIGLLVLGLLILAMLGALLWRLFAMESGRGFFGRDFVSTALTVFASVMISLSALNLAKAISLMMK
jgi:hypothetical protein